MNKQVSPGIVVVVVVVLVIALAVWLYKSLQPNSYPPSPGVAGNPAAPTPNYGKPTQNSQGENREGTPVAPPPNAIPGAPPGYAQAPSGGGK